MESEKLRVDLGEAHRTLIGHFRHEIGHYYWDMLVKGRREDESRAVFGDHDHPTYAEALEPPLSRRSTGRLAAKLHLRLRHDASLGGFCRNLGRLSRHDQRSGHSPTNGTGGESDAVHADLNVMLQRYQALGIAPTK